MPAHGAQQDLVDAIDRGDFPSWTVKLQIMTEEQAQQSHMWPHSDYPLIEIGRLQLNRNVTNYFAETEQVAFAPNAWIGYSDSSDEDYAQQAAVLFRLMDDDQRKQRARNKLAAWCTPVHLCKSGC